MKLKDILQSAGIYFQKVPDIEIKGLTRDSRQAKEGFIFFASKGALKDGKLFIRQALENGAAAVIADEKIDSPEGKCFFASDFEKAVNKISRFFYQNPSASIYCAAVTGTKGKTTVSYMLEKAFTDCGSRPSVIGTVNYRTGGKIIREAPNTTPSEPVLSETLDAFLKEKSDICIMEVSSHALALNRTENIDFDSAVFTNLQSDHMDFHGSRQNYLTAKRKLFERLSASPKKNKIAVINADDEACNEMLSACSKDIRTILYGTGKDCEIRAHNLSQTPASSNFELMIAGRKEADIKLSMIGEHNVYNFLAAFSLLKMKGLSTGLILASLEKFASVPGRLEKISSKSGFHVFIDYAHTEQSLISVLMALRKSGPAKIITVFGCGGDRDKTKRPAMAKAACSMSDFVFITSDNPRTEDPQAIMNDVEEGVKGLFSNYQKIADRRQAIRAAVKAAAPGDFILIAGKGHETYQIIGDQKTHFDDRQEALIAMKQEGKE